MTPKEAIEQINGAKVMLVNREEAKFNDAVILAINALEKQVPKKPKMIEEYPLTSMYDCWGYGCPCCGSCDIDYPEHHCECGQALDWSETE